MTSLFTDSGPNTSLLLLLTLLSGARTDMATWPQCKTLGRAGRLLSHGRDDHATALNLYLCHIYTVHLGSFSGLPNMNSITLSSNDITHLNPKVFTSVPKLKSLGLEFNKLREVPLFEHSFTYMTHLFLHGNLITSISSPDTFSMSTHLKSLDLHANLIEYIYYTVFNPLHNLTNLYLHNNKIKFIPQGMFQLQSLEYITLQHNLIVYVSPVAFRGSRLRHLFLHDNKITHLPANFASDLMSGGANVSQFMFYNNPWHCGFLFDLLAEVKRVGVRGYHSGYYDGTRPVCTFGRVVPAESLLRLVHNIP